MFILAQVQEVWGGYWTHFGPNLPSPAVTKKPVVVVQQQADVGALVNADRVSSESEDDTIIADV